MNPEQLDTPEGWLRFSLLHTMCSAVVSKSAWIGTLSNWALGTTAVYVPELYLVAQTNAGALGAGHVNLAIVERIAAGGLVKGQIVRLYNLNPAGSGAFWIELYNRGAACEFDYQVVRDFIRSDRINRVDRHNDLCHAQEISKWT
jgi:hypothetical protein